jgi:hypothetical protein
MTSKTRDDFGIAPLRRTLIRAEQFLSINITVPHFAAALIVFGRLLHNYHAAFTAALPA